jgi:hypothetical protein
MRVYRKNTKSWAPWNRITKELGAMEWVLRSESTGFSGIVCVESVRGRETLQIIGINFHFWQIRIWNFFSIYGKSEFGI